MPGESWLARPAADPTAPPRGTAHDGTRNQPRRPPAQRRRQRAAAPRRAPSPSRPVTAASSPWPTRAPPTAAARSTRWQSAGQLVHRAEQQVPRRTGHPRGERAVGVQQNLGEQRVPAAALIAPRWRPPDPAGGPGCPPAAPRPGRGTAAPSSSRVTPSIRPSSASSRRTGPAWPSSSERNVTTSSTAAVPQVADQERQQLTGRPVGPVHILDHQHQRLPRGKLLQQSQHQPEQPAPRHLRVTAGRRRSEFRHQARPARRRRRQAAARSPRPTPRSRTRSRSAAVNGAYGKPAAPRSTHPPASTSARPRTWAANSLTSRDLPPPASAPTSTACAAPPAASSNAPSSTPARPRGRRSTGLTLRADTSSMPAGRRQLGGPHAMSS